MRKRCQLILDQTETGAYSVSIDCENLRVQCNDGKCVLESADKLVNAEPKKPERLDKPKRPRRKLGESEMSPYQKKFRAAAHSCKGKSNYRQCVSDKLKG